MNIKLSLVYGSSEVRHCEIVMLVVLEAHGRYRDAGSARGTWTVS